MSHASRDANLLGAATLAIAGRLDAGAADAALVALHGWLGGATIDALARVLALTHSGAVRLVDRLEREDLVRRRRGPDGRSVALHVTRAGARRAQELRAGRERAMLDVLAPLDLAERQALTAILEKLLAGITDGHASAGRICRLCDVDACGHPDRCPVTLANR